MISQHGLHSHMWRVVHRSIDLREFRVGGSFGKPDGRWTAGAPKDAYVSRVGLANLVIASRSAHMSSHQLITMQACHKFHCCLYSIISAMLRFGRVDLRSASTNCAWRFKLVNSSSILRDSASNGLSAVTTALATRSVILLSGNMERKVGIGLT